MRRFSAQADPTLGPCRPTLMAKSLHAISNPRHALKEARPMATWLDVERLHLTRKTSGAKACSVELRVTPSSKSLPHFQIRCPVVGNAKRGSTLSRPRRLIGLRASSVPFQ